MEESNFNKNHIWQVLECTIYSEMMVAGVTDDTVLQRLLTYEHHNIKTLLDWLDHWKKLSEEEKKEEAKEWRQKLNELRKKEEENIQTHILKFQSLDPNINTDEHFDTLLENEEVFNDGKNDLIEYLENGKIREVYLREFLIDQQMLKTLEWLDEWASYKKDPSYTGETLSTLQAKNDYEEKHKMRQMLWKKKYDDFKKYALEEQYHIYNIFEPKEMKELSTQLFYMMIFHLIDIV